ncbi:hypothetical protein LTR48_009142, partial [Friedmanniomyces endolithicus]
RLRRRRHTRSLQAVQHGRIRIRPLLGNGRQLQLEDPGRQLQRVLPLRNDTPRYPCTGRPRIVQRQDYRRPNYSRRRHYRRATQERLDCGEYILLPQCLHQHL